MLTNSSNGSNTTTTTTTNIISHHNILNNNNDQYQYLTNYQQPDITRNIYIPHQKADRIAVNYTAAMQQQQQQNDSNYENNNNENGYYRFLLQYFYINFFIRSIICLFLLSLLSSTHIHLCVKINIQFKRLNQLYLAHIMWKRS